MHECTLCHDGHFSYNNHPTLLQVFRPRGTNAHPSKRLSKAFGFVGVRRWPRTVDEDAYRRRPSRLSILSVFILVLALVLFILVDCHRRPLAVDALDVGARAGELVRVKGEERVQLGRHRVLEHERAPLL